METGYSTYFGIIISCSKECLEQNRLKATGFRSVEEAQDAHKDEQSLHEDVFKVMRFDNQTQEFGYKLDVHELDALFNYWIRDCDGCKKRLYEKKYK